jgi:predicted SAM-dependent methyltransferase
VIKNLLKNLIAATGYELQKIKNYHDEALYFELYDKESIEKRRFYNISAGGHFDFGCGIHHPFWTNIDVDRPWKNQIQFNPVQDVAHDLLSLKPIPVESCTAEIVYSRVTIEHISDDAALQMFKEVERMLKPRGVFRVVAPNIDIDYRAYKNNDKHYFFWVPRRYSIEQAILEHFAYGTSIMNNEPAFEKICDEKFRELFSQLTYEAALDYCISKCDLSTQFVNRENHINWWNPSKLERMLRMAGFNTIYVSSAEQSSLPVLRNEHYFDNVYQKAMMYMEAVKD